MARQEARPLRIVQGDRVDKAHRRLGHTSDFDHQPHGEFERLGHAKRGTVAKSRRDRVGRSGADQLGNRVVVCCDNQVS